MGEILMAPKIAHASKFHPARRHRALEWATLLHVELHDVFAHVALVAEGTRADFAGIRLNVLVHDIDVLLYSG